MLQNPSLGPCLCDHRGSWGARSHENISSFCLHPVFCSHPLSQTASKVIIKSHVAMREGEKWELPPLSRQLWVSCFLPHPHLLLKTRSYTISFPVLFSLQSSISSLPTPMGFPSCTLANLGLRPIMKTPPEVACCL